MAYSPPTPGFFSKTLFSSKSYPGIFPDSCLCSRRVSEEKPEGVQVAAHAAKAYTVVMALETSAALEPAWPCRMDGPAVRHGPWPWAADRPGPHFVGCRAWPCAIHGPGPRIVQGRVGPRATDGPGPRITPDPWPCSPIDTSDIIYNDRAGTPITPDPWPCSPIDVTDIIYIYNERAGTPIPPDPWPWATDHPRSVALGHGSPPNRGPGKPKVSPGGGLRVILRQAKGKGLRAGLV